MITRATAKAIVPKGGEKMQIPMVHNIPPWRAKKGPDACRGDLFFPRKPPENTFSPSRSLLISVEAGFKLAPNRVGEVRALSLKGYAKMGVSPQAPPPAPASLALSGTIQNFWPNTFGAFG